MTIGSGWGYCSQVRGEKDISQETKIMTWLAVGGSLAAVIVPTVLWLIGVIQ